MFDNSKQDKLSDKKTLILDFLFFGLKELRACVFAGSFFFILFLSNHIKLGPIPRYDFLFICALILQVLMVILKFEDIGEVLAISLFHIVGLVLEIYKTNPSIGSWSYPEFGYLKIASVPIYSGFMYASVGSYIMQSWKVLKLEFDPYPQKTLGLIVCTMIYINFFTNHWIYDVRWILIVIVGITYWKTMVHFTPREREYKMPLVVAFVLIAFFIWLAENMATFLGAWSYPDQTNRWNWVSFNKISSWSLLVIISFVIVAVVKQKKRKQVRSFR